MTAVLTADACQEFVNALCPELWQVDAGRLTQMGKVAVIEDAFADAKSKPGSSRVSAAPTPAASAGGTPMGSGDEASGAASPRTGPKKKKQTRNQIKARDERRKARKLHWLTFGGTLAVLSLSSFGGFLSERIRHSVDLGFRLLFGTLLTRATILHLN